LSRKGQQEAGSWQPAANRRIAMPPPNRVVCLLLAAGCLLLAVGCRQQMAETGREKPLQASRFFDNDQLARPLVPGTVARGQLRGDQAFSTGKVGDKLVDVLPVPLTKELLARGQDRFNIFCSPCHGRTGAGDGVVTTRGLRPPPSYLIDRLKEAPIGHFFDVMTTGLGVMPDYAAQVPPEDRWAIAAYIRALQLSQDAKMADLTPADREKVQAAK
jgi:mono/diheme cytochrome c family protein